MRFVVLPSPQEALGDASCQSPEPRDISLGGTFYDYLCRPGGSLAGVRYYITDDEAFGNHPVYRQFRADGRFSFHPAGEHIDIVFEKRDTDALQQGRLSLLVVQDFGGEHVIECDGKFGIVFDLPDDWLP
jgi:hypothetical protein